MGGGRDEVGVTWERSQRSVNVLKHPQLLLEGGYGVLQGGKCVMISGRCGGEVGEGGIGRRVEGGEPMVGHSLGEIRVV